MFPDLFFPDVFSAILLPPPRPRRYNVFLEPAGRKLLCIICWPSPQPGTAPIQSTSSGHGLVHPPATSAIGPRTGAASSSSRWPITKSASSAAGPVRRPECYHRGGSCRPAPPHARARRRPGRTTLYSCDKQHQSACRDTSTAPPLSPPIRILNTGVIEYRLAWIEASRVRKTAKGAR